MKHKGNTPTIAEQIKAERQRQKITQSKLAKMAGINRVATICEIENGKGCTLDTVLAIGKALKKDFVIYSDTNIKLPK